MCIQVFCTSDVSSYKDTKPIRSGPHPMTSFDLNSLDGDGQGGLECCDSWGRKESDMTERLNWLTSRGKKKLPFPASSVVKNLPPMQESRVWFLGWEDPLEKITATYSSIRAWRIPWTEETGRLQSMGSQRVGHDWGTNTLTSHVQKSPISKYGYTGDGASTYEFVKGTHLVHSINTKITKLI